MDLKTLWDRTNDAINTIIRRDESTETGELLQPCIEGTHPIFLLSAMEIFPASSNHIAVFDVIARCSILKF